MANEEKVKDFGNGDRLDHVRRLGERGRELVAELHERGQAILDAQNAAARSEQQSQR